jgi:hypothetical protein
MSILDGDLAGEVADALRAGGLPEAGVLRQSTVTGRDEFGDPITTETDAAIECWREEFSAEWLTAGIPSTDVRVMILSDGLSVKPAEGDKLKLGDDWFQVRAVTIDPAGAAFACQSFGIQAPDDA